MRRLGRRVACLATAALTLLGGGALAGTAVAKTPPFARAPSGPVLMSPSLEPPYAPGEAIVRFRDGAVGGARVDALAGAVARIERRLPIDDTAVVELGPGASVLAAVAALERDPAVLWAEPNYVVHGAATPNDPLFPQLWAQRNTGQRVNGTTGAPRGADINATAAWDQTTGSDAVIVAVVDTGVDLAHPDLAPNAYVNPGEIPGNGIDDDRNGFVDDAQGWDFVDDDPVARDLHLHGTHVAGTIAARGDDGVGVNGVAWRAKIMPVRVLGADNRGSFADIAAGLAYAGAEGADIVNASLGGRVPSSQAVAAAIAAAPDTLFVVAAGNDAQSNDGPGDPFFPCALDAPNLICVAANDQDDALADFSAFGASAVDLAAPGVNIVSTSAHGGLRSDGFEAGGGGWISGGVNNTWALTVATAASGAASLTDSVVGNYRSGTDSFARTATPVSLVGHSGCRIFYGLRLDLERGFDFLRVEASTDAVTWTQLAFHTGSTGGEWLTTQETTPLTPFEGAASVFVRFRLTTDASVTGDGVYA